MPTVITQGKLRAARKTTGLAVASFPKEAEYFLELKLTA